ncbi:hypothetical protein J4423_00090 [Candidatus Pacearchaeota archaeon]|nr:hypothetical protein [Candidatus Pacearchaeota archaeon]
MLNKNNRKGVSEVVANILIVLLVVVGIAVIWSVVKPTVDKSTNQIRSDCFTIDVELTKCQKTASAGFYDVTIKRNPGPGAFENVEIVFEDDEGNVKRYINDTAITDVALYELNTLKLANISSGTVTPTKANVVLRVGGQLCGIIPQPITCT